MRNTIDSAQRIIGTLTTRADDDHGLTGNDNCRKPLPPTWQPIGNIAGQIVARLAKWGRA